ncbi:hypothetical protein J6S39_00950, partial [Candidatus Saccharibacteria bacterium]|nr:hypothetical protein [Candidatus Saccharibacteria bacterium]
MEKNSKKKNTKAAKAPKRSFLKRPSIKNKAMNTYSSLVHRTRVGRGGKKKSSQKKAPQAALPSDPRKRFLAHFQPKRMKEYWFSKRGAKMVLKIFAGLILVGIIAIGGLFLYFKKDLDEIRLDELKVSETVNTYLDRNGEVLWEV